MTRPVPALCIFALCMCMPFLPEDLIAQDAPLSEIVDHIDDLYRGGSSHAVMAVKVSSGGSVREMKVETWSRGRENTLARVLEPSERRGVSMMKLGGSVWSYLPDVDRVIRVPQSMMGAPWMGSHLTNDDAVRVSMLSRDYTAELSFSGVRERTMVMELTLTPRPSAAVLWDRVVATVRRSDWMPVRIEFFGGEGGLSRTVIFADVRALGNRKIPSTIRIIPAGSGGEHTEVTYQAIRFDVAIDDKFFSLDNLKNPEPF